MFLYSGGEEGIRLSITLTYVKVFQGLPQYAHLLGCVLITHSQNSHILPGFESQKIQRIFSEHFEKK